MPLVQIGSGIMMDDDVFTAMIKEEFSQYQQLFLYKDKQLLKEQKYKKLAEKVLRQAKILSVFVLFSILFFSLLSVYHFVQYGTSGNTVNLWLGIGTWIFVIFSTIFYSRDVIERKKSVQRVLKLLDARKEYYQSTQQKKEAQL